MKDYRTRTDQREGSKGQMEMLNTTALPFFQAKELVRQQEINDMTGI